MPNKMQRYTVYLYLKTALQVSGGTTTQHQERKQPSTASGICQTVTATCRVTVWQIPDAVDTAVCAPDDGWW
jgi:hypothetical protein